MPNKYIFNAIYQITFVNYLNISQVCNPTVFFILFLYLQLMVNKVFQKYLVTVKLLLQSGELISKLSVLDGDISDNFGQRLRDIIKHTLHQATFNASRAARQVVVQ